ncbi:hypothetical protein DJ74_03610 [Halorubrum sp. Ea8]|nr:hypothetical protein DJ74_03610 [Halorubrum sp. Ea8]
MPASPLDSLRSSCSLAWSRSLTLTGPPRVRIFVVSDGDSDLERLKEAVTHYRDDAGPKIRPARGAWGRGQTFR